MNENRIETTDIILALDRSENQEAWRKKLARKLRVHPKQIQQMRLVKHSIDARKKDLKVQLRIEVGIGMSLPAVPDYKADYPTVPVSARKLVIVGCGPAGTLSCRSTKQYFHH